MKIPLLGDFHGNFPREIKKLTVNREVDLVVSVGDHGDYSDIRDVVFNNWDKYEQKYGKDRYRLDREILGERYEDVYSRYAESMESVLKELNGMDVPVYVVHGNTDFTERERELSGVDAPTFESVTSKMKNLKSIGGEVVEAGDTKIGGIGGYRGTSVKEGRAPDSIIKKSNRKIKEQIEAIKSEAAGEIVVGHDVPYGCKLDEVNNPDSPKHGEHVGDKIIGEFLADSEVNFYFCGHMHEYHDSCDVEDTKVVDCGLGKEGKGVILELPSEEVEFIDITSEEQ